MRKIASIARNFVREDEGATMVEYAIMLAAIAAVCVVAVRLIGTNANTTFNTSKDAVAAP